MELVEGDTLAERIEHGPLPIDDTLTVAKQICEALEAAHEKGVTHRDLKPANVKITPAGLMKVLDFGLAKLRAGDTGADRLAALTNSPTMMPPSGTLEGVILGTAASMAPEQAKGKTVDARSDIWAFGVVLYEMLVGKTAFGGETIVEILGGVLKTDPDWTALPATTPVGLRSLLKRCLQKDRNRRLRDIADARFQIEEALNEPAGPVTTAGPVRTGRERLAWSIAAVSFAIAEFALVVYVSRALVATDVPETRLQIVTPQTNNLFSLAVSPDGRTARVK